MMYPLFTLLTFDYHESTICHSSSLVHYCVLMSSLYCTPNIIIIITSSSIKPRPI